MPMINPVGTSLLSVGTFALATVLAEVAAKVREMLRSVVAEIA